MNTGSMVSGITIDAEKFNRELAKAKKALVDFANAAKSAGVSCSHATHAEDDQPKGKTRERAVGYTMPGRHA